MFFSYINCTISNPRTFHPLLKETSHPLVGGLCLSLPQLLVTSNLVSVSVDVCVLDVLYEWSCTACGLLHLAFFHLP